MFVDHYNKPVDYSPRQEQAPIDRTMPDWLRSASEEDIIMLEALNHYRSHISKGGGGGFWGEKAGNVCSHKIKVLDKIYKKLNLDKVRLVFTTDPLYHTKDKFEG